MNEYTFPIQSADWKTEKHVPVIDVQKKIKAGELIKVAVSVGKEIPHPNTTEHHIGLIVLTFHPDGEKFPYEIGRFALVSHGSSAKGPNTSTVYSIPEVVCTFKTEKSGNILAISYCNIHGFWSSSVHIDVM